MAGKKKAPSGALVWIELKEVSERDLFVNIKLNMTIGLSRL